MIRLYNTLTRKKQEFKPVKKNKVGLYTCGLTVYNYAHIGNLRTYIFEDILRRALEYNGYKVKHVQNITDVGHLTDDADQGEDKLETAAKKAKKNVWELAKFYTQAFKQDLINLNILKPDIWCQATDHIKEQIKTIQKIAKNGFTYQTSDGIYFNTAKLKNYGKLTKQDVSQLKAGIRVAMGEKKNPTDFALWKFSNPKAKRQMEWPSPWGKGFPGWHIECSAMATHYLGVPFDIHCGGVDHIAIHHTNEIAQTEAAYGKNMANFWLHGEFLIIDDARMGKSEGNFITLKNLVAKGYNPLSYRYFVLNTHYRQKLNLSWRALDSAQNALKKLYKSLITLDRPKLGCAEYEAKFLAAINDDLNIPQALAVMWDMLKSPYPGSAKAQSLFKFDKVLGLKLEQEYKNIKDRLAKLPKAVNELIEQRKTARQQKDWNLSDELRDKILELGYQVEDTKAGQKISLK